MVKERTNADLSDVLDELKSNILKSINCVQIGEIQSFDNSNQTATIKLSIKKIQKINKDGSRVIKERPLLLECPVFVLQGGSAYISMPIENGDTCIVLFNDRDIDNWFIGGSSYPNTLRLHDMSDAFALVGINNLNNVISDYLNNQITIKLDDNDKIEVKNGSIEVLTSLLKQTGNSEFNGNVTINGNLSVTGAISSSVSVTAPSVVAITSATVGGQDFDTHTHSSGTYSAGGDNVSGNSGSVN